MTKASVLVVEDDGAIRRGVVDALSFSGFTVHEAADGVAGLKLGTERHIDLAILDIMMPGMDGLRLLTALREKKHGLPVILLTARGEEDDRVRGLRLGADDYVVKPFGLQELVARIEAVLRRSAERAPSLAVLEIAGRRIDFGRREARLPSGEVVALAEKEAEVLSYLAGNRGRAVSREELLRHVWGFDPTGVQTRTVDMAVARLREQLGDDSRESRVVLTVRGRGYMLGGSADGSGGSAA